MPQNLSALGTSGTGTVLTWMAFAVSGNGKVARYEMCENGQALASTTNTSFIVTRLTPARAMAFLSPPRTRPAPRRYPAS